MQFHQLKQREFITLQSSSPCQITNLDLSGPRGALHAYVAYWHKAAEALATQCPELAEEADISQKWGNSRFDPLRTKAGSRFRTATPP